MKNTIILSGETPLIVKKKGRNELCKCGSGKKNKKCCGTESEYFNKKKTEKQIESDKSRQRNLVIHPDGLELQHVEID